MNILPTSILPDHIVYLNVRYDLHYIRYPNTNQLLIKYKDKNNNVLTVTEIPIQVKSQPVYAVYTMLRLVGTLFKYYYVANSNGVLQISNLDRIQELINIENKLTSLEVSLAKNKNVQAQPTNKLVLQKGSSR